MERLCRGGGEFCCSNVFEVCSEAGDDVASSPDEAGGFAVPELFEPFVRFFFFSRLPKLGMEQPGAAGRNCGWDEGKNGSKKTTSRGAHYPLLSSLHAEIPEPRSV